MIFCAFCDISFLAHVNGSWIFFIRVHIEFLMISCVVRDISVMAQYCLFAVRVISDISVVFCCGTASVVLDIGRPVKVTASTTKLQHILNMTCTFHDALLPVVYLAKPAADAEKASEGDTVLPQMFHFIQVNNLMLKLSIMFCSCVFVLKLWLVIVTENMKRVCKCFHCIDIISLASEMASDLYKICSVP